MANKTVIIKIKRQATPDDKARWEEFEGWLLASGDECDLFAHGNCGESGDARWQADHADHLRLELPGGDLQARAPC